MSGDRRARILATLRESASVTDPEPYLVAARWAELVGMTGAGLTLMTDDGSRQVVRVSDGVMDELEDLQLSLGEGPCFDAFAARRPVLEPDLVSAGPSRWVAFAPAAIAAGARAIFTFPLEAGAVRLGTLELYRDRAGMPTTEELADSLVLADLLTEIVLDLQAHVEPGVISQQLTYGHEDYAMEVHQATGMVAAQLDANVTVALARLRAHAFAAGMPLTAVAGLVLAGQLRLDA